MKIRSLIILAIIATLPAIAWGETRRDGNWWSTLARPDKTAYVVGFFDGMKLGWEFSYWKYVHGTNEQLACIPQTIDSYTEYNRKYLSNVTNVQVADGLDTFYKDFKNRSILINSAVWLVLNQIAGTPESELDIIIQKYRRNPTQ